STYARLPDSVLDYVLQGAWLGPLWFIGNLIVYCASWALIDGMLRRLPLPAEPRAVHLALATAFVPVTSELLAALGNRVCSSVVVFVSFPQLYEFAPFFALGAFVQARRAWLVALVQPRRAWSVLVLALVAMQIATAIGLEERSYTLMLVVRQSMRLALALAILGSFRGVTSPPQWVRRMTTAAYTVYVLHAPVVVALYVVLEPLQLGMAATFLILCVVTAITTVAIHERVVAPYPLAGFLFNGARRRRDANGAAVSAG
ncbi:MAG: acyltransferase family protein, partial [Planctomycetes bacterium]|nr:acyltransferase family protein [Planctomycetota bacterium]